MTRSSFEFELQFWLLQICYHITFGCLHYVLALWSRLDVSVGLMYWLLASHTLYWVHRCGHNSHFKHWFENHTIGHHAMNYPKIRFYHPTYLVNIKDKNGFGTLVYVIPIILELNVFSFLFELTNQQITHNLVMVSVALLLEYGVHQIIHTRSTPYTRNIFMNVVYQLHFKHHSDYIYNYGIVNMTWDIVYQTFK